MFHFRRRSVFASATGPRLRLALVAAAALLAACGGTIFLRTWQDPSVKPRRMQRVVVLGFSEDAKLRAVFEDTFVSILRERGNDVVAAHTLGSRDEGVTREQLQELVAREGFDGVLTAEGIVVTSPDEAEKEYTPYLPLRDGDLYQYFFRAWRRAAEKKQSSQDVFLFVESRLYDTDSEQLLWAGVSRSERKEAVEDLTRQYAKTVLFELSAKGFLE